MTNDLKGRADSGLVRPGLLPKILCACLIAVIVGGIYFFRFSAGDRNLVGNWKGTMQSSKPDQSAPVAFSLQANGSGTIEMHPFGSNITVNASYLTLGRYFVWKSGAVTVANGSEVYTLPQICHYVRSSDSLVLTDLQGRHQATLTKAQ